MHSGYFVPFVQSLEQLLNCPEILQQWKMPSTPNGNIINDFHHASYSQAHQILSDPHALKIIGYFDEIEIVNPIGSARKKHKLGVFMWQLGNIHPQYRSSLHSINLCAVAKASSIRKCGIDLLLADFIQGLNQLAQGIHMNIE
jgi:hypothetical protein